MKRNKQTEKQKQIIHLIKVKDGGKDVSVERLRLVIEQKIEL